MKRSICALLSIVLLLSCTACGAPSAESSASATQTPAPLPSVSSESEPTGTVSSPVPSAEPVSSPEPSVQPSPAPSAAPTPSVEPTPAPSPADTPAPSPEATPEPEPEPTMAVDPDAKLLPNIFTFLYHDRSPKNYQAHGKEISCNGSHPGASFEGVKEEILALLAEEQYQLELVDSWINPHYSTEMHDYFYRYTGTAEGFELLTDKYEEHEFHVMFRITYYPEYDYFKLSLTYSNAFDVVDPEPRTLWDMEHNGEGGLLTAPPEISTGSSGSSSTGGMSTFVPQASRLDCLTCKGDGDCNTCGGDGYTGFGSAKAGCRTCHGNGKCRACGGSGKR